MAKKYIFLFLIFAYSLIANDGFDDEFSDNEEIKIVKLTNDKKNANIYGDISFLTSYNYAHSKPRNNNLNDFRGFSSSKLSLDLIGDYKFKNNYKSKINIKLYKDFIYNLKKNRYKTIPQNYNEDIDINELYIQGDLTKNIDFKIGRQIIVWGKSDNIRITDIINPLDKTTLGMTDIKNLRIGVGALKLDYFKNQWTFSNIILIENRFSKMPKYGSDFAPQNKKIATALNINSPSIKLKNIGVGFSASGNFQGQDLAFYAINKINDNSKNKINMLGFAYNKVLNSFLLKTEVGYFRSKDIPKNSKTDALLGIQYNAIPDGNISFEVANKDKNIQYALRYTQNFLNKTLDFTTLYSNFGKNLNNGGFLRTWIDYDYDDNIDITFGFINYFGSDLKFDMLKNNDRVFVNLKYNF